MPVFKYSIQDIVDELEVTCSGRSLSRLYANATSPKYQTGTAGNEKDMPAHKPQVSGLTIAVHFDQMQPLGPVRYQPGQL